ncbi:MAG TPA: ribose-phosphate pyrophosphokinase [Methylomirabilota bacterium]|nr:ribose-phosphate pyrophosphokinase [Methylomirabilota bacterium]
MKIFSGTSNKPLAEKIAHELGIVLSPIEIFVFPDGEKRIQIQDHVVDEHCVVVQSTATPGAENYMELLFIIDGLKRSGASEITVVIPYLGYQRQDHIFRDGEAVSLDVVVRALEATGAARVITLDLHSIKIPEIFTVPVQQLSALSLFAEKIKELGEDGTLVSPDMGGLRRISKLSELLDGMAWIATVKDRDLDTGKIVIKTIEGDTSGLKKRAFIVDDMIASGGTIVESAKLLEKHGVDEIFVFVTHPVLSEEASDLLQNSLVKKVFVTDTVFVPQGKRFPKLEIISIAKMVADALSPKDL